jgi:hypothetical protein
MQTEGVPESMSSSSINAAARLNTPELVVALEQLRRAALDLEESCRREIDLVGELDRASAINLVDYLAVRQFDLRPIQRELASRGLSSLGRAEAHVLATIDAVLTHLVVEDGDSRERASAVGSVAGHPTVSPCSSVIPSRRSGHWAPMTACASW